MALHLQIDSSGTAIARRLKFARVTAGYSQSDLGRVTGKSSKAVQHWEAGDSLPPFEVLVDLTRHLPVDAVWLVTGVPCDLDETFKTAEARRLALPIHAIMLCDYVVATSAAIGARLRTKRRERKSSLAALGKLIGKSGQGLQHWEVGNSEGSPEDIVRLCSVLDVDPIEIIFGLRCELQESPPLPPSAEGVLRLRATPIDLPLVDKVQRRAPLIEGRSVPLFSAIADVLAYSAGEPVLRSRALVSHFPCSSRAFAFEVDEGFATSEFPTGTVAIIDPDEFAAPDCWVMARSGELIAIGQLGESQGIAILKQPGAKAISLGKKDELYAATNVSAKKRLQQPHLIGVLVEFSRRLIDS